MPEVRVGDLSLCYESMGTGEPLLMIMGVGAQMIMWHDDLCRGLVERGFRVIRYDHRDIGQSTRLDHLGTPRIQREIVRWGLGRRIEPMYGLEDLADDAAGLLSALGVSRAHVLGASMGGMVAQLVAIRHPQRVASLTSIMSHPGDRRSSLPWPRALRALMGPVPRSREQAQDSLVAFYRVVGSPGFTLDEDSIRERAGRQYDRGISPRGMARHMMAILAASDRRPALRGLRVPALVVHGTADPLVRPIGAERTAAALAGSRLLYIKGMGHELPRAMWPRLFEALAGVTGVQPHGSRPSAH